MTAGTTPGPIRVLQVVQRFYPELGGLETHVAEVTSRLADLPDIEVTVLTTDRSGRLPRQDVINGVPVIRRRSWPRNKDYYFSPGLVGVIRRGDWDVVHLQGGQTFVPLVGMLAALSARRRYVLTFHSGGHSTTGRSLLGRVQTRILTPLLSRADRLIAVSRFEKKRFAADTGIPAERFTVINNGGALPPVPTAVQPVPGTIVSSGRLEKYKGHHRAIEALPLVRKTIPDARLTILGAGPYEADLRALAEQLGVADVVTIRHLAPTERAEMAEILAGSAVMVALSSYEAHPVGVMEALAIGLPVLGCDVAGIGDLVEDGLVRGIDVAADAAAVADALVEMLDQPGAARRSPAPELELPTWETSAAALAQVYREVSGQRPAPAPLRIVQVITTLTTGGAERQLQWIVEHSSNEHRTIALYEGGTVAQAMLAGGAQVELLGMAGFRKALAIPRLALWLRQMRPDVVHAHLLSAQLWAIPAARLARVPVVVSTEHSLMDTTIENRPLTPALRRLYLSLERLVTRTVAVSSTTRDRLIRWGVPADRIAVIDNGIDFAGLTFSDDGRQLVRAELGLARDTVLIGGVGRLEPVKRFPELLDALAPTLARGGRELVLVGDGPLFAALRRQAEQLGVTDSVHLTGPRGDVRDLLSAMDVLVSPSRDETFGMAVLEALAAGLPVVYAACPAIDELGAELIQAYPLPASQTSPEAQHRGAGQSGTTVTDTAAVAPEAVASDEAVAPDGTASDISRLVDLALADRPTAPDDAGRRYPLPESLAAAYGIDRTARSLDLLYAELVARATGAAGRRVRS